MHATRQAIPSTKRSLYPLHLSKTLRTSSHDIQTVGLCPLRAVSTSRTRLPFGSSCSRKAYLKAVWCSGDPSTWEGRSRLRAETYRSQNGSERTPSTCVGSGLPGDWLRNCGWARGCEAMTNGCGGAQAGAVVVGKRERDPDVSGGEVRKLRTGGGQVKKR
eukprot:6212206-Pleurochrysis_carterae.AAC.2